VKRRAYIGLSSPTAYFYDHDQAHFRAPWRWNPILESPQGLITLFDELWFLTRPLCPLSFRNEKYVKFLDEDSDFEPLIKALAELLLSYRLRGLASTYDFIGEVIDLDNHYAEEQFRTYNEVIEFTYGRQPGEGAPIDNHSHPMDVCGYELRGDSMRLETLAFDIAFLGSAGIRNIELITNSFNSVAFKTNTATKKLLQVSEGITIKRIPVLQTPAGPVIDRIDSIRESNFLVDFRKMILTQSNPDDFGELVADIEDEFFRYRNNVLIQKQKGSRVINSLGKNALSLVLGTAFPGSVEAKSLRSDRMVRKFNWTGFIAGLEVKNKR